MQQLSLTFELGLSQRSRCLRDHMATRVYSRGLVETAGKMDLSPSKLTEKLAGSDSGGKPRGMTIDEFENYLEKTKDLSPVYYLVDKYLRDPVITQQEAMAKFVNVLEMLGPLASAAGIDLSKSPRRGRA